LGFLVPDCTRKNNLAKKWQKNGKKNLDEIAKKNFKLKINFDEIAKL